MASAMGPNKKRTKPPNAEDARPKRDPIFSDWAGASAYLNQRLNVEQTRPAQLDVARAFNLDRMHALMDALGNPHRSYRTVHVAGSKGKGSTCEMTAACLRACGYTVGLYTSPHLVRLGERIRIDQDQISEQALVPVLDRVAGAATTVARKHGEATWFEVITAAAFQHFADQAVDVAVIETGMGGRLDATNVVTPEVTAISAIQKEHTQILGDTLEKIALEKAGIFKPGVPAVSVPQAPGVLAVLRESAAAVTAPLHVLNDELEFSYRFESSVDLGPHARVCLTTPTSNFEHLPVPLKGEHQAFNCGLALAILDKLRGRGLQMHDGAVAQGLATTPSNGRLELALQQPRVFIDGAHNPDSVAALIKAIGAHVRYDSMVVVFGCAADKDISAMLGNIAMGADKIIFTKAEGSQRAMDPRELQRRFAEVSHKMAQTAPTVRDAVNIAGRAVSRGGNDIILVTGSFAVAGEAKRLIREKQDRQRELEVDHAALREVKEPRPHPLSPESGPKNRADDRTK
jgi:dihydrofolate synthase/folylpolyglutamate synthase